MAIQIEFDLDALHEMIRMWRESTNLQIPMKDEFKIHMMKNRRSILNNFERTAGNWLLMVGCMKPVGDVTQFAEIRNVVQGFHDWAKAELAHLDEL